MADTEQARWRMTFSGRVQFVGFRFEACRIAKRRGITGWVENLPDGRVAMEAQGDVVELRRLVLELKSRPQIRVTGLEIEPIPTLPREGRFGVRGLY